MVAEGEWVGDHSSQGVTKRRRLSWLTNINLAYEPKCGWRGGGEGVSANEYSCTHGAQINFGDLTPYLTQDSNKRVDFFQYPV